MTLLVAWIGRDSRKISSIYIASDSRFSWTNAIKFDYGRKVFALVNSPDILGYCGDVLYPTIALTQIMEMDRDGILFPPGSTNNQRSTILFNAIKDKFINYPSKEVLANDIEIIHASRDNEVNFICNIFRWTKKDNWQIVPVEIPDTSDKIIILGTGEKEFYNRYLDYYRGINGKTSRAIFKCLTHSLLKMKDLNCGGPPQLVGLYNRFNGKNFGVIYEDKTYYLGKEVTPNEIMNNIEWRNELFEVSDGFSKNILPKSQKQPDELR
jgi:hypothetical protein